MYVINEWSSEHLVAFVREFFGEQISPFPHIISYCITERFRFFLDANLKIWTNFKLFSEFRAFFELHFK